MELREELKLKLIQQLNLEDEFIPKCVAEFCTPLLVRDRNQILHGNKLNYDKPRTSLILILATTQCSTHKGFHPLQKWLKAWMWLTLFMMNMVKALQVVKALQELWVLGQDHFPHKIS